MKFEVEKIEKGKGNNWPRLAAFICPKKFFSNKAGHVQLLMMNSNRAEGNGPERLGNWILLFPFALWIIPI